MISETDNLSALGSGSSGFAEVENAKEADTSLLEAFPNPMSICPGQPVVQLGGYEDPKEFTSLCPKTGQPDFARIVVEYVPNEKCVESKSWKLYLGSFRSHQDFHEACVARIAKDLVDLLDPHWLRVTGEFTPRGGISINPVMEYNRQHAQMMAMAQKAPQEMPEPL